MANFCTDCIHWERIMPKPSTELGVCDNVEVQMNIKVDSKVDDSEGVTIWTSPYFGCVYWRDNDGSIVDFEDIIDDETGKPIDDDDE